jgi:hypothetical protein
MLRRSVDPAIPVGPKWLPNVAPGITGDDVVLLNDSRDVTRTFASGGNTPRSSLFRPEDRACAPPLRNFDPLDENISNALRPGENSRQSDPTLLSRKRVDWVDFGRSWITCLLKAR